MPQGSLYIDELENLKIAITASDETIEIHLSEKLEKLTQIKNHLQINGKFLQEYLIDGKYLIKNAKELPEKIKIECVDTSKNSYLIASFNKNTVDITQENSLTNYELRSLTQFDRLPIPKSVLEKNEKTVYQYQTDLHTHYPALMTSKEILNIATKGGTRSYYCDKSILKEMGINVDFYEIKKQRNLSGDDKKMYIKRDPHNDELIDISQLKDDDYHLLTESLSVSQIKQITFEDMEKIYERRDPFVKNIHLFEDYLWTIAKNYEKQGIKEVSISFSKIIEPDWLLVADKCLTDIQQQTGVSIGFLVGISRHELSISRQNTLYKTIKLADHPAIRGFDILASEVNSTYDFAPDLVWAMEHIKSQFDLTKVSFVIRIHAGETAYHPENVRGVLEFAKKYPDVQVRIGHGIYGAIDEETLRLARGLKNIIFEMIPDSNFALNMLDIYEDYPIDHYVENGIPVVLGTDGHGLYQTTYRQLQQNIQYFSKNPEEVITNVQQTEKHYVNSVANSQKERELLHLANLHLAYKKLQAENFPVPALLVEFTATTMQELEEYKKDYPHCYEDIFRAAYTIKSISSEKDIKHFKESADNNELKRAELVSKKLKDLEITTVENISTVEEFKNKQPIMIAGLLKPHLKNDLNHAKALVGTLLKFLDPKKMYFISDGSDFGLNKLVHKAIKTYNSTHTEAPFQMVGLLSDKLDPDDISKNLTHVTRKEYKEWYQLPECIGKKYKDVIVVAMGSDGLIRDTIQVVHNVTKNKQKSNLYLLNGAKQNLPSSDYDTVLNKLFKGNSTIFNSLTTEETLNEGYQQDLKNISNEDNSKPKFQSHFFRPRSESLIESFVKLANGSKISLTDEFNKKLKKWSNKISFEHEFYQDLKKLLLDEQYDTRELILFCSAHKIVQKDEGFEIKYKKDEEKATIRLIEESINPNK